MERRLSQCAFVTFMFCLNSTGLFAASGESSDKANGFIPAKPFSSVLVEYNRHNPEVKSETRLLIGEQGMRSETLTNRFGNVKIIFIRNHQTGQAWLADPVRRTYSVLPRGSQVESSGDATEDQPPSLGVLANIPCVGMNGSKQSTRTVGESELSIWRCSDERGRTYLQHYSTLLGVVIRQETLDGWISELRDIAIVNNSLDYYKPSNDYHKVSLGEFFMGKRELPNYEE